MNKNMLTMDQIKTFLLNGAIDNLFQSKYPFKDLKASILQLAQKGYTFVLNAAIKNPEDINCGVTAACFIAAQNLNVLVNLAKKEFEFDLNAAPQNPENPYYGMSLAWFIANQNLNVLVKLAKKEFEFDLNAAPQNPKHPDYGMTLAWLIAIKNPDVLVSLIVNKGFACDLNAAPQNPEHPDYGMSIAWYIAYHDPDLLLSLIEKGFIFDLNAAPRNPKNAHYDATVAWLITVEKPNILSQLITLGFTFDLNAAPQNPEHPDYDIPMAWFIATQDLNVLVQLANKGFEFDLNAAPKNPEDLDADLSVAFLIALKNPSILVYLVVEKGFACDLNAAPQNPEHPNYRQSVANILIDNGYKSFVIEQDKSNQEQRRLNYLARSQLRNPNDLDPEKIVQDTQAYQIFLYMLEIYAKEDQPAHAHLEQAIIKCFTRKQLQQFLERCQEDHNNETARSALQAISYMILKEYYTDLSCPSSELPPLTPDLLLEHIDSASELITHIPHNSRLYQESWALYGLMLKLIQDQYRQLSPEQTEHLHQTLAATFQISHQQQWYSTNFDSDSFLRTAIQTCYLRANNTLLFFDAASSALTFFHNKDPQTQTHGYRRKRRRRMRRLRCTSKRIRL